MLVALRIRSRSMETPGIPSTRWFDATHAAEGPGRAEGQPQGHDRVRATAATPSPACRRRRRASRSSTCWWSPIRIRPPGRCSPSARTTPICCRSARSSSATARARPPTARSSGASRSSSRSSNRRTTTRCMYLLAKKLGFADRDVQEHQGRERRRSRPRTSCARSTAAAGRPAIAASRRSASRRTWRTRTSSTWSRCARQGRPGRSAATITACRGRAGARRRSGIPARHMLYNTNLHVKDGGGTFRARFGVEREEKLPDGRTSQGQPARRGLLLARLGDPGRLSRVHLRGAQEARLGQGPHRGRDGVDRAHRRQQSRRRRPGRSTCRAASSASPWSTAASTTATARRARMRGTCPTRCRCTASRSTRRGRSWSRSIRPCPTRCSSGCPTSASRAEGGGGEGHRQGLPDHPHLRPSGRIRGRRRGDALQQVARRAAAGHVRRDQSGGRGRARHQGRRLGLGLGPGDAERQGAG